MDVVYNMLIKHADAEQLAKIDAELDAPFDAPQSTPDRQRLLTVALGLPTG